MIRPTAEDDLPEILSLAAGLFKAKEVACVRELLEVYLYKPGQEDYVFLSYKDGGRTVGFICYGPTPLTEATYDLYWIGVDKGHQNHGVGSALLHEMETQLRERGARLLLVETSSMESYLPARRFYEKHGFQQEAIIKDFYAPGDDLVIYSKRYSR